MRSCNARLSACRACTWVAAAKVLDSVAASALAVRASAFTVAFNAAEASIPACTCIP